MKRSLLLITLLGIGMMIAQCDSNQQPASNGKDSSTSQSKNDTVIMMSGINSKGIGRFKNIQLSHPLDSNMANSGKEIYEKKCFACHKLTTEILVGPGWANVTNRRTPEWIMNWITNTKVMIDKDQAAQADMAVCLIRMPNQDLNDSEARQVLEFMRQNDSKN